jgi:hypothetical protein
MSTDLLLFDDGPARRRGIVRANGRAWTDDGGSWHPLGATLFWAPYGWRYNDQPRVRQTFAWLQGFGVDYTRMLGEVGWPDEVIDPRWPDYQSIMAGCVDAAYDTYGLRTLLTLRGGGTDSDPLQHAHQIVELVRGREHKFLYLECANESTKNGPSDEVMRQMIDILRPTGLLVAPSSPDDSGQAGDLAQSLDATAAVAHFDRSPGENGWRAIRQPWCANGWGILGDNAEGIGPRSSCGENCDPLQLAMYRATGIVSGCGAFVLHNGAGVYGRPQPQYNRPANLWEVPGIDPIMQAVQGIDALLPAGVENWSKLNAGWMGSPLVPDAFWPDGADHGIVRVYSAVRRPNYVTVVLGVKRSVALWSLYQAEVTVHDPLTGTAVRRTLTPGSLLRLDGPDDAHQAYLIHGTF